MVCFYFQTIRSFWIGIGTFKKDSIVMFLPVMKPLLEWFDPQTVDPSWNHALLEQQIHEASMGRFVWFVWFTYMYHFLTFKNNQIQVNIPDGMGKPWDFFQRIGHENSLTSSLFFGKPFQITAQVCWSIWVGSLGFKYFQQGPRCPRGSLGPKMTCWDPKGNLHPPR